MTIRVKTENSIRQYFAALKDGVLCVYMFGSTAAGKDNKFSDVDIAVLFEPGFPKEQHTKQRLLIMDELSRIIDRDIDVVVLNEALSFLKYQIIKYGKRVYESPDRDNHSFEARAIVEYLDFLPIRRRLEKAMIDNIKKAQ